MKCAVVTGVTGFLGSHVARRLVHDGWDVVGIKRSSSDTRRIDDLRALTYLDADRDPLASLFPEGRGPDAVFHFATDYGRGNAPPSTLLKANTLFPLELLELASRGRTPVFLNADTCYTLEYKHLQAYTLTKKQLTQWGKLLATPATRFINLILQHPYGPGDGAGKFVPFILRQCLENTGDIALTPGEQCKDFIYVEDVLDAVIFLLDRAATLPAYADVECGSGRATSIREFVTTAHRVSGSRATLQFGALPYRENEIMFSQADTAVLNSLGWRPQVGLEEGLRRIFEKDFGFTAQDQLHSIAKV